MASIRGILGIFSREATRDGGTALDGEELVTFIRRCTDSALIDDALQQAGHAPFWPQDERTLRFYQAAGDDKPLAARLKAAADRSAQARRAALAHLFAVPDPQLQAVLPRRQIALAHLIAADTAQPENSRSFMRLIRAPRIMRLAGTQQADDTLAAWGGDITDALRATAAAPHAALLAHITLQIGEMVQLWLHMACGGAIPAALDATLRATLRTAAQAPADSATAFAALRIAIAACPRLPAPDRAASMEVAESAAVLIRALPTLAHEHMFTCRDDRALVHRGWGERLDIHTHALWLDGASSAHLTRLTDMLAQRPVHTPLPALAFGEAAQMVGICVNRADGVRDMIGVKSAPYDALAEMALFARLIATAGGNRALRQYWDKCEETGVPSLIGTQMGLVLGDLQQVFEELTRRTRYHTTPDVRRLQDRMLVRALSPRATPPVSVHPVLSDSA